MFTGNMRSKGEDEGDSRQGQHNGNTSGIDRVAYQVEIL